MVWGACSSWLPCGSYLYWPQPGFGGHIADAEWKSWVKEICSICFPVAVIAGISILVFFSFHFSDDYIPGAWSDFSFFANLAAEKAGDISKLMTRACDCRDREMLLQTAGCMLSGSACSMIILKFPRPPLVFIIIDQIIIRNFPQNSAMGFPQQCSLQECILSQCFRLR